MNDPKIQRPTKKEWDEMTPEEQAAERQRLVEAELAAERPDPDFEKFVDKNLVGKMKNLFKNQKVYPIMLFQITPAMKAEGQKELPPRECGINGYNFVVPRGVPVMVPESLAHILHQCGEINDMQMVQMGLLSMEQAMANLKLSREEAERLANLGKPL